MSQATPQTERTLAPTIGEIAPDKTIRLALTGELYSLSKLWEEGPAVVVFLRHLGCTFCREHIAHLQKDYDRFEKLGVKLGLITVAQPEDTLSFCRDRNLLDHFVCLSDPEKQAYQTYGLSRAGVSKLLTANVFMRGFQSVMHGHLVGMPKGDPYQMPGLFIVDRNGIVKYAHRSKDASDNPSNSDLFRILERLSESV